MTAAWDQTSSQRLSPCGWRELQRPDLHLAPFDGAAGSSFFTNAKLQRDGRKGGRKGHDGWLIANAIIVMSIYDGKCFTLKISLATGSTLRFTWIRVPAVL